VVIDVIAADDPPPDVNEPLSDRNERPKFEDHPTNLGAVREVAENSPGGTLVGAPVTATDADGDALTYALSGADAFVIDAATGQIRVADGAVLDYETATSYTVTVSATDGKNAAGEADPTIDATVNVTIDVLDQLPPAKPAAPTVAPSAAAPTSVLDVTWTAPANDGRPGITDYDLRYRAVGASQWTAHEIIGVGFAATLQGLEPGTSYLVQVAAANVEGPGPWSDVGLGRTQDGNKPPVIDPPVDGGDRLVRQVAENAPGGAPVGAPIAASDADGDALTYTLFGANAFVIDAASGQIRVAAGTVLDYESTTSYAVTVGVSDGKDAHGNPDPSIDATVNVTIEVLDQAPPAKPDAPAVAPLEIPRI